MKTFMALIIFGLAMAGPVHADNATEEPSDGGIATLSFLPSRIDIDTRLTGYDVVINSVDFKDVVEALRMAVKHLSPPSDLTHLVYIPPAERLRRQADAMEQQEVDLQFIREILEKIQ